MDLFRFARRPNGGPPAEPVPPAPPRVLFLDDDPQRAEVFLGLNPQSVWVQTAAECIARLAETWDEVHLDHDLGGELFVDMKRDDCGMEVVRWLCLEPRPHLAPARFYVHSHNTFAATLMSMQLQVAGFAAEMRPFGAPASPPSPFPDDEPPPAASRLRRLADRLRSFLPRRGEATAFPPASTD
jgi:hypothetical protein